MAVWGVGVEVEEGGFEVGWGGRDGSGGLVVVGLGLGGPGGLLTV